jgi:hypothetical protein
MLKHGIRKYVVGALGCLSVALTLLAYIPARAEESKVKVYPGVKHEVHGIVLCDCSVHPRPALCYCAVRE